MYCVECKWKPLLYLSSTNTKSILCQDWCSFSVKVLSLWVLFNVTNQAIQLKNSIFMPVRFGTNRGLLMSVNTTIRCHLLSWWCHIILRPEVLLTFNISINRESKFNRGGQQKQILQSLFAIFLFFYVPCFVGCFANKESVAHVQLCFPFISWIVWGRQIWHVQRFLK